MYSQYFNALITFAAVFVFISHLKVAPPHPRHCREQTHLSYHTTPAGFNCIAAKSFISPQRNCLSQIKDSFIHYFLCLLSIFELNRLIYHLILNSA